MIIINYFYKLVSNLQNENIPKEEKLVLALFIFSIILLLSYLNTRTYFLILIIFFNKTVQDLINQWYLFKNFFNIYGKTRIRFLIFEICLSLYIILFILYYSQKIYTFYLIN
jgi:hypothetical protein